MKIRTLLIGAVLLGCVAVHADGGPAGSTDAAAAFARLKTLAGEWDADAGARQSHLSYELVAGGSALLERETGANRPAMLTVYHLDGERLLLTHYCMAGNQPRMQARAFDAATGSLTFEFLDATNLASPGAGHMHSVAMRLIDANHLATEWKFYENGQPTMTEAARYARAR